MTGTFGTIGTNLSIAANQSLRRNSGDSAFETYTPVTTSTTDTFTNKRITPRIGTTTSSATPTPAGDDVDMYTVTALAEAATFGAPTGTPVNGQKLIIRILDDGTARTLAWNAIYKAIVALPTTTIISKYLYVGFIYCSADSKWHCVATSQE